MSVCVCVCCVYLIRITGTLCAVVRGVDIMIFVFSLRRMFESKQWYICKNASDMGVSWCVSWCSHDCIIIVPVLVRKTTPGIPASGPFPLKETSIGTDLKQQCHTRNREQQIFWTSVSRVGAPPPKKKGWVIYMKIHIYIFSRVSQVRHIGVSNETPYGVTKMAQIGERLGLPRICSVQVRL